MNVRIEVDADGAAHDLAKYPPAVGRAVERAIRTLTLMVERGAKIGAPVDTGRLRASISTEFRPMAASVSTHTNYAQFVHDGTRFMRPRPFMREAADAAQEAAADVVASALRGV